MDLTLGCTIAAHFADLPDPRIDRAKRHDLLAIVTIALCGVICGADGETITTETRCSLSSLPADPLRIGAAVRAHWGIENGLHWVLDLAFREDESRVRTGDAAENLAVLRRLALTLLRREPTAKVGIKAKRLMCGWDETYLAQVLAA